MELLKQINEILKGWGMNPATADWFDQVIAFVLVLIVAFAGDFICRRVLLRAIARLVQKTKATWDDILFDRSVTAAFSLEEARTLEEGAAWLRYGRVR